MKDLSEHEKAILAIEALAMRIGDKGEDLKDRVLLNIAADLQLFMITAMMGDLNSFLEYVNAFREKKIQENIEEMEDIKSEIETGKKVTPTRKIARMKLSNN
jgi:hypothetical protein